MSHEETSAGMLSIGDWARKARQMHDDLMSLMCAGVLSEKMTVSRAWLERSYQTLVGRLKQVVTGPPLDHLAQTPKTVIDICLALGQIQVTFEAVQDYLLGERAGRLGFWVDKQAEH
jgi:hypothetical protein